MRLSTLDIDVALIISPTASCHIFWHLKVKINRLIRCYKHTLKEILSMDINKVTFWPGFRCTLDKSSLNTTCLFHLTRPF